MEPSDVPTSKPPRLGSKRKKERTRDALVATAIRLIASKGIEGTSVLEITETLGISNGSFYYYFPNMDQLLQEVGHTIVASLVEQIEGVDEVDPAARIARGPLLVLRYVDAHPEIRAVLLRVIEDPEGLYPDLHTRLRDDVAAGKRIGRFPMGDVDTAVRFCRSLIGSAVRLRHESNSSERLAELTATHTLAMLGVPFWEAATIVDREQVLILQESDLTVDDPGQGEALVPESTVPAKAKGGRRPSSKGVRNRSTEH